MSVLLFVLYLLVLITAVWPVTTLVWFCARYFWKSSSEFKFFLAAQSMAVIVVMLTVPKHW